MPRVKQIDYQRVTFSFPKKILTILRMRVGKQNMSKYVSGLVKEDLKTLVNDRKAFIKSLKDFSENVECKTDKSSLEILREIRYGKN